LSRLPCCRACVCFGNSTQTLTLVAREEGRARPDGDHACWRAIPLVCTYLDTHFESPPPPPYMMPCKMYVLGACVERGANGWSCEVRDSAAVKAHEIDLPEAPHPVGSSRGLPLK